MKAKGFPKSRQGPGKGPKANERLARAAGELQEQPFVGIRITSELQRHLDKCDVANRHYFERREPQSLRVMTIDGKQILGRPAKRGATIDSLEDAVQNIKSILLKICPQYNVGASEIKVYSAESTHGGSGG